MVGEVPRVDPSGSERNLPRYHVVLVVPRVEDLRLRGESILPGAGFKRNLPRYHVVLVVPRVEDLRLRAGWCESS